ncbi:MAG: hypothetical protein KAY32_03850 [Candidatus Eisenbacteria sp.]|nr:hypothetical protein [Candidatus Eisenbacteria bacterium]
MSSQGRVPVAVLSQRLSEAIAGRRVRVAAFTTFTFDPAFFELHVLPTLFDQSFSQIDKVRRIQLEDAMRAVDQIAVYYDRSALSQDGEPAQLDYRRIDVRRATGCFHPKLVLLLVDDPTGAEEGDDFPTSYPSLIVGILSANLTRAGWWESVECAHFEEVKDRDWRDVRLGERSRPRRCPFRRDLLHLLRRVSATVDPGEDESAIERIRDFLRRRTIRRQFRHSSSSGVFHTRIFGGGGRAPLAQWLGNLRLYQGWNLEVISPFFSSTGAGPLVDLKDVLEPKEIRVYLPRDADGSALVTPQTYDAIAELANVSWGELQPELIARGRDQSSKKLAPRGVHAKVYRLWHRDGGDLLLVGSVNLTESAHSAAHAGNLEAAFLVDVSEAGIPRRWWLERREERPSEFLKEERSEEDGLQQAVLNLGLRFDWAAGELSYRLMEKGSRGFQVRDTTGGLLFEISDPRSGRWTPCPKEAAEKVRKLLVGTSFVLIQHPKGQWRVLIREENMAYRPSLLTLLTPEEILEYWSLLTPDQRAVFFEEHGRDDGVGIVDPVIGPEPPDIGAKRNTIFDRFGGIYHAFNCLHRHVCTAIDEGRERDAEARLLGAKYDSLPSLLEKSLARKKEDPIIRYVTFLCAKQTWKLVATEHREFMRRHRKQVHRLESLLRKLPEVRGRLPHDCIEGGQDFIVWYERAFLRQAVPEETDA